MIRWKNGAPFSDRFKDIYHTSQDGLAETDHVFLKGAQIAPLFQKTRCPVVAELGFGTGLNFLATMHMWRMVCRSQRRGQTNPPNGYMHFVSVEGYPLTHTDLADSLAPWTHHLSQDIRTLLAHYPKPQPQAGYHRIWFPDDAICLTLLIGPVSDILSDFMATVDAWFLDGFAPAVNPDMWTPDVLRQVARLSRTGATLATFTAAGTVRRTLESVGFHVRRCSGFGRKRHMITAVFNPDPDQKYDALDPRPPWMRFPCAVSRIQGHPSPIPIAGTGIAGGCVARAFQDRGYSAHLYETANRVAHGASGNTAALVKFKPFLEPTPVALFYQAAFNYARILYSRWPDVSHWTGCLEIARSEKAAKRQHALGQQDHIAPEDYTPLAVLGEKTFRGIPNVYGAATLGTSGWIAPVRMIEALTRDCDISTTCPAPDNAILCAGPMAWDRPVISSFLGMMPRPGQVTEISLPRAQADLIQSPVSWGSYVIPLTETRFLTGATWDTATKDVVASRTDLLPTEEADRQNLAALESVYPAALPKGMHPATINHRVGIRATTPDRLPYVGPIADAVWASRAYASMYQGRYAQDHLPDLKVLNQTWCLLGLGARGMTTAPLAAELLVSQMLGDPWPVPVSQAVCLAPIRYILRRLKTSG